MAATFPGVCAVVPAAGFGRRMQTECPKQYLSIGNKTILEHAVAALLAALLVMDRLFRDDWQDGSLEQLMLLPTPLVAVVLVKVVAHWMMSGLPLLIVSPLAALLLGMSLHDAGVLALTLLLGTPTLSFLGAVGVGLTVGLKRGGVLLSLLV
ncbi:TPA: heme exporter protein CcmB, partial [Klebsiella pneumoniae]|nr:heme exporter protein CcmB [Klebsiella pneumoniae]